MSKLLKWVLAAIGIIAALFVVAAFVLPMVIDPNNYKEKISAGVLDETGRELVIGGEIQWTVFPSIGLGLADLELGNREGFGDLPMISVGEASVSVKLLPLLRGKMEIGKVGLSDLLVNLERKANGQNNWDDLSSGGTTAASDDKGTPEVVVSGVEISNANVIWRDIDQVTELKSFSLKTSAIVPGEPFDVEGGFSVNFAPSLLVGKAGFSGRVQSSADGNRIGIEGLEFSFAGTQGPAEETMNLDLGINANADIDLKNDTATLSGFSLRLHDLLVSGNLDVSSLSGDTRFEGRLNAAQFSPKSLFKALGLEAPNTSSDSALTSLQAAMNFVGTLDSAKMRDMTMKLDESNFNGRLDIANFDRPRLAFDFEIDRLNLDDYLTESDPAVNEPDLTVGDFKSFTGGGDLRIGELRVAALTATDVSMTLKAGDAGMRISPIKAQFYGGRQEGDINIDASGQRPLLTMSQKLTGVQAGKLLADVMDTSRLQGVANFEMKITTDLTSTRSTSEAMNGNVAMKVVDGAIVGVNITEIIRVAKLALNTQTESEADTDDAAKTEFSELTVSGVIERGILRSNDLDMRSPLMRVTGKGTINLVDETINYVAKPVLLKVVETQSLANLSGVPIPVKITGNLYEPDIAVDIVAAIAGSQKAKIDKKKDEVLGKLLGGSGDSKAGDEAAEPEGIEGTAKSLLKGLLGGKKDKDKDNEKEGGGGPQ